MAPLSCILSILTATSSQSLPIFRIQTMEKAARPIATEENSVGKDRQEIYGATIRQYSKAMQNGYYIEAISLMESLIADRLESLANYVSKSEEYSYCTLGKLSNYLGDCGKKSLIPEDLAKSAEDVKCWAKKRNHAMHEMAKLKDDCDKDFDTRYQDLEGVAQKGMEIFRTLDSGMRNFRRNNLKK